MFIDSVEELEETEVFHYKCPNPQCKITINYKNLEQMFDISQNVCYYIFEIKFEVLL